MYDWFDDLIVGLGIGVIVSFLIFAIAFSILVPEEKPAIEYSRTLRVGDSLEVGKCKKYLRIMESNDSTDLYELSFRTESNYTYVVDKKMRIRNMKREKE